MTSQVKALATKADKLSSMPGTQMVRTELTAQSYPPTSICTLWHSLPQNTHKIDIVKNLFKRDNILKIIKCT